MKRIVFSYDPKNLDATAEHLAGRGDFPRRAAGTAAIATELRQAVVEAFDRVYAGRMVCDDALDDGVLHPAVLWRGIACTFTSSGINNCPSFVAPTRADAASPSDGVIVTLHVTPGERDPNTVDTLALGHLIEQVDQAKTAKTKGNALEVLAAYVFSGVPGFEVVGRNRLTTTEEIDLVVENGKDSPFYREGQFILVECKKWSGKCGKNEVVRFRDKIRNRRGRCSLGFLLSWAGFARTVRLDQLRHSRVRSTVVPLSGADIRRMLHVEPAAVLQEALRSCVLS